MESLIPDFVHFSRAIAKFLFLKRRLHSILRFSLAAWAATRTTYDDNNLVIIIKDIKDTKVPKYFVRGCMTYYIFNIKTLVVFTYFFI